MPGTPMLEVRSLSAHYGSVQALSPVSLSLARGELDAMYAYARASLLRYARWMAEHEVPTLSRPEVLEYHLTSLRH